MMQSEFEQHLGKPVSSAQYEVIETVYTFYPKIGDKAEVAKFYKHFGMVLFKDLLPRAKRLRDLDSEAQTAKRLLDKIQRRMKEVEEGADILSEEAA